MGPEMILAGVAMVVGPGAALGLTKWILSDLKEDIRELREDVKEINSNVTDLREEVARQAGPHTS